MSAPQMMLNTAVLSLSISVFSGMESSTKVSPPAPCVGVTEYQRLSASSPFSSWTIQIPSAVKKMFWVVASASNVRLNSWSWLKVRLLFFPDDSDFLHPPKKTTPTAARRHRR